ncbi:MAG: terminase small subunit [Sulfitobacter litoralis]|nr:terminase small subunit [Sulfitobacter litoralis]
MSDTLTANQEAFALCYVETGNAAKAYRQAYDKPEDARDNWIYVEASKMLDHPKVSLRIKELQSQAAKLSLFNIKSAFDEYEEARQLAKEVKNPSAAVAAISGKVKLFGLDQPTKFSHTSPDGTMTPQTIVNLSNLSDKELKQLERLTDKAGHSKGVGEA